MRRFRSFMKHQTEEKKDQYKAACREAENVKRNAKKKVWEELGEKLEADYGGGRKLLYSIAKKYRKGGKEEVRTIKDKDGELLIDQDDIDDRWRQYFEELLNVAEVNQDENEDDDEPIESEVTALQKKKF